MCTHFNNRNFKLAFAMLVLAVATDNYSAELTVLTYHDVVASPGDDIYAVSRAMFVAQMDYLQTNSYRVISLAQLQEFRKNPAGVPRKAVMLTFDDGLRSYHEFVVPVLNIYGFPSITSIVTGWLDGKNLPAEYHGKLMSWDQIREISVNPLVEIASHTHDLHYGIQANPQGSYQAAAITRRYSPLTQSYEDEKAYQQRISTDFKHSMERIKTELGIQIKTITWPYGLHDNVMAREATKLGLTYQLSLGDGATPLQHLPRIKRIMLMNSGHINDFEREITYRNLAEHRTRFAEISLQSFASAKTLQQQEVLLSKLLDHLEPLDLNTIVLSPFSPDGSKAFFQTEHMPVAADIINRAIHLMKTKLNIRRFYLTLPSTLQSNQLHEIYTDLARMVRFHGIVFPALTSSKLTKQTKTVLDQYVPELVYGTYYSDNQSTENFDFFIAAIDKNQLAEKNLAKISLWKGHPAKMYITHTQSHPLTKPRFEQSRQLFENLGLPHFGYRLDTDVIAGMLQQETYDVANDVSTKPGD